MVWVLFAGGKSWDVPTLPHRVGGVMVLGLVTSIFLRTSACSYPANELTRSILSLHRVFHGLPKTVSVARMGKVVSM